MKKKVEELFKTFADDYKQKNGTYHAIERAIDTLEKCKGITKKIVLKNERHVVLLNEKYKVALYTRLFNQMSQEI